LRRLGGGRALASECTNSRTGVRSRLQKTPTDLEKRHPLSVYWGDQGPMRLQGRERVLLLAGSPIRLALIKRFTGQRSKGKQSLSTEDDHQGGEIPGDISGFNGELSTTCDQRKKRVGVRAAPRLIVSEDAIGVVKREREKADRSKTISTMSRQRSTGEREIKPLEGKRKKEKNESARDAGKK